MKKFRLKKEVSEKEKNFHSLEDCLLITMEITVTVAFDENTTNDSVWFIGNDGKPYPKRYIEMFYEEI